MVIELTEKSNLKYCVFQSILAIISFFIMLLILTLEHIVIIISLGATAFIVFATPKNITARPKNVIGGHIVGLLSGSICFLIPHSNLFIELMVYSLAVGLSILIMILTDTGHPPASGTALGIAMHGFSIQVLMAILIGTIILSLIKYLLKPYLKNLL